MGRLALAHMVAYPLIYVASAAAMPLAIMWREPQLLAVMGQQQPHGAIQQWLVTQLHISAEEAASFEVLMEPIVWLVLLLLVVTHVAAIPWAWAAKNAREQPLPSLQRREQHARKMWLRASLVPTLVVVVVGALGWLRVMLM